MQTTTNSYLDRVLPAIDLAADRFVTLVTGTPDPAMPVPTAPGWTVRDVAAHLVTVTVRYADGPKGRGGWTKTPIDLPALNHDQIATLGTVTVGELAARLRQELTELCGQIQGYGNATPSFASTAVSGCAPTSPSGSSSPNWWCTAGPSPGHSGGPIRSVRATPR